MKILNILNSKWPLGILILFVITANSSCNEQNDLKNSKAGSSESDVAGSSSAGFVVSAISGSTTEAGGTATFTVNLNSQPSANVSNAISSSDTTEGTVSPSSIIFTPSNWSTAQTVTVTGIDDTAVDGNIGYTVVLGIASSIDSNYSGLDPTDVSVTNNDDDTPGITFNSNGDNTTESGGSFTLAAKLNSQPSSDVTFTVSSSDTSEGSVSQSSITFTSTNWGTTQWVSITGVDDYSVDGNQNYTVIIGAASSSDSNYYGTDPDDLSVINIDDDTAGFTVTTISGVTTEYGTTATFTVKLSSQPTANVTIAVSSSDTGEGTVSPSTLTFTSSNWSTTQTVTATGVNDGSADGNQSYNIVLGAASSSDSNFNAVNPADVSVTNTDDDTAGFTISSISDNTTELGDNATFTVLLTSQPSANVTIGVSSSDTGKGTVSPSSLTFTNSNWNTAQTVTVTGVDDNETDGDQNYTIVLAAASSSDSNYNNLNPSDVSLSNIHNDWKGIRQLGSTQDDNPQGMKIDSSGNVYIGGSTWGGLDGNTNAGSRPSGDIFLLKYNSSGIKQWTKQTGIEDSSGETDFAHGLDLDSDANIYLAGVTDGDLDGITNSGGYDIFLMKYNSSGTKQWTKLTGNSYSNSAAGVALDPNSNNIYVTGVNQGTLDGQANFGGNDIFLIKYDSSGTKQWTRQTGSSLSDNGRGIGVDSFGNIYVAGGTHGGLDGNSNLGATDAFIMKYNSSGTKQWTRQFGTSSTEDGWALTVDNSDNIYVVGKTYGGLDGNTNAGGIDFFLVKYNSSGTKQWTKQLGTSVTDEGLGLTTDYNGNIFVTGITYGGLDGNSSSGGADAFLVKYNSSGDKQWTKQFGTSADDNGWTVEVGGDGYLYLSGYTHGGFDNNTNAGSSDIFVVRLNSNGIIQ